MGAKRKQFGLARDCDEEAIIPGMPDDVALLCLAGLPSRVQAQTCCVSVRWKHALESQLLFSLRLQLQTVETQLLLCFLRPLQETYSWWGVDPLCVRYFPINLPSLPLNVPLRPISTPSPGQVLFLSRNGDKLSRIDVFHRRSLCPSAPLMLTNRDYFASASLDRHVYVAGGYIREWHRVRFSNPSPLKSVERLDCTCMSSWESLPDMHIARAHAAAVALHGQLYVIGGMNMRGHVFSGEIWDPEKQEWSVVPELWPSNVFHNSSAMMRVAVVMGRLLAIKKHSHEVMVYEDATKLWTSLGCVPLSTFCNAGAHRMLHCMPFGVAEELWVLVQKHSIHDKGWGFNLASEQMDAFILACMPFSEGPLTWQRLPYCFDGSNLIAGGVQITV